MPYFIGHGSPALPHSRGQPGLSNIAGAAQCRTRSRVHTLHGAVLVSRCTLTSTPTPATFIRVKEKLAAMRTRDPLKARKDALHAQIVSQLVRDFALGELR